ncbi:UDP-3-O-acyl-N-acetylglucosamine deacetylase [Adhaeretor mobilis]|uniref:UDP-3-O-acyl-N-acetylglucosamine deacetylase n=1 Tax=Adhaeretor mobilis TaxID=1930276 RepID=A0A517MU82_9BACT|nr:UDP-3-O-acyl-N-acetylglucosamine deacetylase [Adhaeretor mobilis]QDS98440.1 UDP-3-O-[3-hydroxymyristoyl] N-acetylglucosamine deacetylase [Adhaeretor mobilis]
MIAARCQNTIARPSAVHGFGYWSGEDITVEFRPAPPNSGITFVRQDLGADARIPARTDLRAEVPRRTNLKWNHAQVEMVEHVLAALAGLHIDNCEVWVDRPEMPGCDGSALPFVEALQESGVVAQAAPARQLVVTESIRISDGECWIEAHPSEDEELSIEFQLDYPHNPRIGRQSVFCVVTPERFQYELAPCRTFILASEAEQLTRQGLGTRVTPQDLLVYDEQGPIDNPLRFANECARHKALDVLGDLALTGCDITGHIVAYRSSHRLNSALASLLVERFALEKTPLKISA